MIAACSLCGQLITGKTTADAMIIAVSFEQKAAAEIMDFDLLAAAMANHLSQMHGPQAMEMLQCQNLTAKVYAMTHASSSAQQFEELRAAWREGIKRMLFPADYAEAAPSNGSASSSPLPASAS
jgi:hypothetical protein